MSLIKSPQALSIVSLTNSAPHDLLFLFCLLSCLFLSFSLLSFFRSLHLVSCRSTATGNKSFLYRHASWQCVATCWPNAVVFLNSFATDMKTFLLYWLVRMFGLYFIKSTQLHTLKTALSVQRN